MCKQHFIDVAGRGGAGFNYWAPPNALKINHWSGEMSNRRGKSEEQRCCTELYSLFGLFSNLLFCVKYWIILSVWVSNS